MKLEEIKTPEDILQFMNDNIEYGWIGIDNKKHIRSMKNFRKTYRTANIERTLETGLGTCIEQVRLMSELLDRLHIDNKMFCTRIYEGKDFNDLDAEEHMHCFVLYYLNDKVYQMEHPNWERIGIYEFKDEEDALKQINNYYVEMADGVARPLTEFFEVKPDLTFKEFNDYINSLDEIKSNNDKRMNNIKEEAMKILKKNKINDDINEIPNIFGIDEKNNYYHMVWDYPRCRYKQVVNLKNDEEFIKYIVKETIDEKYRFQ